MPTDTFTLEQERLADLELQQASTRLRQRELQEAETGQQRERVIGEGEAILLVGTALFFDGVRFLFTAAGTASAGIPFLGIVLVVFFFVLEFLVDPIAWLTFWLWLGQKGKSVSRGAPVWKGDALAKRLAGTFLVGLIPGVPAWTASIITTVIQDRVRRTIGKIK